LGIEIDDGGVMASEGGSGRQMYRQGRFSCPALLADDGYRFQSALLSSCGHIDMYTLPHAAKSTGLLIVHQKAIEIRMPMQGRRTI
jgi:hypothetical protein